MEISRRNKLKKSVEKTIITLSFMAIVLGGGYWSNAYRFTDELIASVMGEIQTERNIKREHIQTMMKMQ